MFEILFLDSGNQNDKIWIGLKNEKWMTGSAFENIFEIADLWQYL